jgi:hypothetical protein
MDLNFGAGTPLVKPGSNLFRATNAMRTPPLQTSQQATDQAKLDKILKLGVQAQRNVIAYSNKLLEKSKQFTSFNDKMDAIDVAYARYQAAKNTMPSSGVDPLPGADVGCDIC